MKTFLDWIADKSQSERSRLETAVREYMKTRPEAKRCYYITRPRNVNFDPNNQKHVEDELGSDYDKNLEVVPFKHHPQSFTCVNVAEGLAKHLREKGFKARKVAGWYGNAERGYSAGYAPGLDDPERPQGFGSNPQQHWWVEVGNYIVDLTSAQFHPTSPKDQNDLVIRDKSDAIYDGSYMSVRRFPLGRSVRLPSNVMKMIDKIVSLKKFASKHSSVPGDNRELSDWIMRNREKFSLPLARAQDAVAALKATVRPGFYFSDRRMLERTFGEAFDDLEEDEDLKRQDENPEEFRVEPKRSRGTVRFGRSAITLSSTYPDDLDINMEMLMSVVKSKYPEVEFGRSEKYSEKGAYGNTVHHASARVSGSVDARELTGELKRQGFRLG